MANTGDAKCGGWKVAKLADVDPDVAAFLARQQAELAEAQAHAQAQRARADEWYWLWLEEHERAGSFVFAPGNAMEKLHGKAHVEIDQADDDRRGRGPHHRNGGDR